jgi:hypothetical protein
MPAKPSEWSVIVLGFWNRAILTPSGIAKHLFALDAGTPVEVFVAIDMPAPHQVKYEGVTVVATNKQLIIQPDKCDFDGLQKAKEIGCRALANLPLTPVIASGINLKYISFEPSDALQQIARKETLDNRLSDEKYEIVGRSFSRSVKWNDGQVNFSLTEDASGKTELQFNFHRESNLIADLRSWMQIPVNDIEAQVGLLSDCLQINGEIVND